MNIKTTGSKHAGPAGSQPIPAEFQETLKRALTILRSGMRNHQGCNSGFKALPGSLSFKSMLDDGTIWISYDPSTKAYGYVYPRTHPKDIVLGAVAFRMGRWSVAATIVHEAAHLNGAPGLPFHDAEMRVKECRMMSADGPYDPTILG